MVVEAGGPDTRVEHLGHTSFLVARGGVQVLVDPIVVREDLDFRRPTVPRWFFGDFSRFSAVLISHGHNDHLHPPSLLGLPAEIPIHFLAENPETCSCPEEEDPYRLLPALGFRDLRPFRPGDRLELGGGLVVHVIPAQSSTEGEEQCCFLFETPDALVLDAVDIKDDAVTREALAGYRGRIDLAFIPTGAALQWQGFWNQMDTVEALAFCDWLQPAKIAACGGSLSLSERARPETLERYPHDLADWLVAAGSRYEPDRLLTPRPPFRAVFREHRLARLQSLAPTSRFEGRNGSVRAEAVLTTFFTGYHPRLPTKRLLWPDDSLRDWLGALQPIREVVRNSRSQMRGLLERCGDSINKTPASLLAPATLRHLVRNGAWDVAAQVCCHVPESPADPADLEASFFAVLEAVIEDSPDLPPPLRDDLRACAWIDRRMFQLRQLYLRLRGLTSFGEDEASILREQHLEALRSTVEGRRPVLGPHHIRLSREQIPLLTGEPPAAKTAELLCYASPQGVYERPLSVLEAKLLDLCDGRRFGEIVGAVEAALGLPGEEVHAALFSFLARLSRDSVLLVDWSR